MPEATMICCDASEWMRNGDFQPNRFDAQKDALSIICSAKTEQNRENTVGLICMGKEEKAEVLVNCTTDVGRILQNAHKMRIYGKSNILVALQTAQLALKHRKNKKQTQRIIVFVGSPVTLKPKQLQKVGKRLKKNNVAVDIINFGESDTNLEILQGFIKCVNSNNNSHLVNVESNTDQLLSDVLISSPLFAQNQQIDDLTGQVVNTGQPNVPSNQPQSQYEVINGIRREDDPELWEAMKQSMLIEEERIKNVTQNNESNNNDNNNNNNENNDQENDNEDEEDEELMRALQMSIEENAGDDTENNDNNENNNDNNNNNNNENNNDVDVEMNDSNLEDGNLLGQLIEGLPGLNNDDIDVDQLLQSVDDENNENTENNKNDDKNKKDDKN